MIAMKNVHQNIKMVIGLIFVGGFFASAVYANVLYSQQFDGMEPVTVSNYDGTPLAARVYFPSGFVESGNYPAIIVSHGDGVTKEVMHYFCVELLARGWIVVSYDYAGHGDSGVNSQMTNEIVNNTRAVFDFTRSLPFVDTSRIGVLGHSRGGLVSMDLSDEVAGQIAATVSISGPDWYVRYMNMTQPRNLLLIAGSRDTNVSPATMFEIYRRATGNDTSKGVVFGDFALGTAREYVEVDASHEGIIFSEDAMTESIAWFEQAFYGVLRYPVQIDFKLHVYVLIAAAGLGILACTWGIYAIHALLVRFKVIGHEANGTDVSFDVGQAEAYKRRKPDGWDPTRPFILLTIGVGAGMLGQFILRRLYLVGISPAMFFGLFSLGVPFTGAGMGLGYIVICQLILLGLVMAIIPFVDKKWSKKGERNVFITRTKGKWLTSAAIGALLFAMFYLTIGIVARPLYDVFIDQARVVPFLVMLLIFLGINSAAATVNFKMVQSRFIPKQFRDTFAALLIGIFMAGGIIGGGYILRGGISIDMLVYCGISLFLSSINFHYFRSVVQEVVFSSLLGAWLFAMIGVVMI